MGYAKYVGRVGALAVALGFGAAVATSTPGIAYADGTDPDPAPPTNQDATPQGQSNPGPDPAPPAAPEVQPSASNPPGDNKPKDPDEKPVDPNVRAADPGEVISTGGFQQDEHQDPKEPEPEQLPAANPPPPPAPPAGEQHVSPPPAGELPNPPVVPPTQPLLLESNKLKNKLLQQSSDEKLKATLKDKLQQANQEDTGQLQRLSSQNENTQPLSGNTMMTTFSSTEDNNPQVMQTMAAADAPATTPTIRTVFTGFLALVGLGPLAGAGTPSLPFIPAPIFDAVFAFFRRVEATFSNETPRAKLSNPEYQQNGDMTGVVEVEDDFGDGHTYVISQQGKKGTATVDAEGNVTYTADPVKWADATLPAGPDTFVVTVSDDTGFHIHAPGTQHTTTVAVTAPGPVAAPNPADGKTNGTIPFTNTTGAPVTFTETNDEQGEFEVRPDGTWTFTPDPETRHAAAKDQGAVTSKTYTVEVKDEQGNVIDTVEVTVPISGANENPVLQPDPPGTPPPTRDQNGVITGSFTIKDGDNDQLDVDGLSDYGTVLVTGQDYDPNTGITTVHYTVTPPDQTQPASGFARMSLMSFDEPEPEPESEDFGAMRMMALDEPEPESLTTLAAPPIIINFTIRDGYGGNTPLTVSVPVDENGNPTGTTVYSSTNPTTGAIEITVNASDPDGDPLSYSVSVPTKGTLELVDGTTNTWVYTPSDAARHQAVAVDSTVQDRRDAFTVTVTDTAGNSVAVPVTVSLDQGISPDIATSTPVLSGNYLSNVTSPDGKKLYIVDYAGNSVKVIDTKTNKEVATVATGATPYSVAMSPSGDRLYVSNVGDGTVTVIDTATNTVVGNPIDVGGPAPAITVSPDGNTLYASGFDQVTGHGRITVVDTTGHAPNQTIDTGTTSFNGSSASPATFAGLSVSPDGTKLYGTGNFVSFEPTPVTVVDLTTSQHTVTTLDGSSGSVDNELSPDGSKLYVTNVDGKIHVYDTATGAEAATPIDVGSIAARGLAGGISISPDGRQALVTDETGTVHVIALASGSEIGTIDTDSLQHGLVQYTANGAGAYLLNFTSSGPKLQYITGNTANTAPTFTVAPVSTPASGPITYHVSAIGDVNSDPVTISVNQPAHGTVAVVAGDYVYTPTDTRVADTIIFTATDAHGGITTHTINVPAAAATNAAPEFDGDIDIDTVSTNDGTLTGSVTATDDDGDDLTYALDSDGAKGHAVVNTDGTWTYTPNPDDRHDAAALSATEADRTDAFTITVTDGHGGTDTQTITVDLTPQLDPTNATVTPVTNEGTYSGYVVSPDGKHLYVVDPTPGTSGVKVIDTTTNQTVATVPISHGQAFNMVLSEDGDRLYVGNIDSTVTAINTSDPTHPTEVGTVNYGDMTVGQSSMALSPDGETLYISSASLVNGEPKTHIAVIETDRIGTAQDPIARTIETDNHYTQGMAISDDGTKLYTWGGAFEPDGSFVYDKPLVIDTATGSYTQPASLDFVGNGVTSGPGGKMYITTSDGDLKVVDTSNNTVVRTIHIGGQGAFTPDVNEDGTKALVFDGTTTQLVDLKTGTVTPINGTAGTLYATFAPSGTSAYALKSNNGLTAVALISGNTANAAPTGLVAEPDESDADTGVVTYALSTDPDGDGDVITYVASSPANGAVTINNGLVTYTPNSDPVDDQFTIIASDGHGGFITTEVSYTAPVPVGVRTPGTPLGPPVLSPNGDRALQATYVPSTQGGTYITVIDTATGQAVNQAPGRIPGIIQDGETPHFNSTGTLAFYTTYDPVADTTYFTIINVEDGQFLNGGPIAIGQRQTGPVIYEGDRGYITTTTAPSNPDPSTSVFIFDSEDGIGGTNYRYNGDKSGKLFVGGNNRAYLVVYHDDADPASDGTVVQVFDTSSGYLLGQKPIDAMGTRVGDLVIDDVNHRAYLTTSDGQRTWVTAINSDTGEPIRPTEAEITGDASGRSVVLSSDGQRAYQATTKNGETTITVINTSNGDDAPLTPVTGTGSANILLDNNDHLYLVTTNSDGASSTIRSIDTNTGAVLDTVPVSGTASSSDRIFVTKDGDLVIVRVPDPESAVGTPTTHAVIFDTSTGTVVTDFETRGLNLVITEADNRLYVANETVFDDGSGKTRVWILDAHSGDQLTDGPIEVEGHLSRPVVVDGSHAYQVTYDDATRRMRVAVINLESYEKSLDERITLPGSLDDYRFTVEDDGTASLIAYSHDDNEGTTSTTFASVDSTTGDVEIRNVPNHAYLVRDEDGSPQYLVAAFADPSTNETFVGVLDVDTGEFVGQPYAIAGQLDPSLGAVVVDDDGTAYVTTRLQNQDGTYATRVTPIPGAVPSTSGFRMMTLGGEAPTPPSALNVTYPEQINTNPLIPQPFSSTNVGPSEFDVNSLLSV